LAQKKELSGPWSRSHVYHSSALHITGFIIDTEGDRRY
jgi:hypothetical protein